MSDEPPPPAEEKARRPRRAKGDGGLYKMPDGRWRVTVDYGYQPNKRGEIRRKRAEKIFNTEREARSWLRSELRKREAGQVPTSYTVASWLTYWLTAHADKRLRPSTLTGYKGVVRNHISPALGRHPLDELRHEHIQSFIDRKAKEGYAAKYLHLMWAVLSKSLAMAVKLGYLTHNPAQHVEIPRTPEPERHALTSEQARKLLDTVKGHRLEALFAVCLYMGLRRGEALALRWEDIDLEGARLHVRGTLYRAQGRLQRGETKTRNSTRDLIMPGAVIALLRAHRRAQTAEQMRYRNRWQDTGYVFTTRYGTPIEPRNFNRAFDAALEKAGLPHVRLHDMRRSAGSLMLKQGVSLQTVSKTLGHSSIRVTGDVYTHIFEEEEQEAARRMDDLLGG